MSLNCKKPKLCEPITTPAPEPCSTPFTLCVGDRTLKWDGFCPTVERTHNTPDGTYTSVTVVDGCIVSYGHADEATYTPPYCSPNPTSCQETSAGKSTALTISPSIGNTLSQTSQGLFAKTRIEAGTGIAVTGDGTQNNPYNIALNKANTSSTGTIVAHSGLVSEINKTTNVTRIGMETVVAHGTYDVNNQFTVDEFGRITNITKREEPLVQAGEGLDSNNQGDTVSITHPTYDYDAGVNTLGAYEVTLNASGHVTALKRTVKLDKGIYNLGVYNVSLNEYGSITNIIQREDTMPSAGTFTASGKEFTYDITGRLTGVKDAASGIGGATNIASVPMPLRDMYKFNFSDVGHSNVTYRLDTYGSHINVDLRANRVMTIPLPAYIIDQDQVQVNGATTWRIVPMERLLEIKWGKDTQSFTVVFRG